MKALRILRLWKCQARRCVLHIRRLFVEQVDSRSHVEQSVAVQQQKNLRPIVVLVEVMNIEAMMNGSVADFARAARSEDEMRLIQLQRG